MAGKVLGANIFGREWSDWPESYHRLSTVTAPYAPYRATMASLTTLSGDATTNWCRMVIGSFIFAGGANENACKKVENKNAFIYAHW